MKNVLLALLAVALVVLALIIVFFAGSAAADTPRSDGLPLLFVGKVMIFVTAVVFFAVFLLMSFMIIKAKERYQTVASELKTVREEYSDYKEAMTEQIRLMVARVHELEIVQSGTVRRLGDAAPGALGDVDMEAGERKPNYRI